MKLKLNKIADAQPSVVALMNTKLPVGAAFRVARAAKILGEELQAFDKVRLERAAEFGTLSEDGMTYNFEGENTKLFNSAMEALLNEEVDVPFDLIPSGKLGDNPVSERVSGEILSIPIYPESTSEQRREVVGAIAEFMN